MNMYIYIYIFIYKQINFFFEKLYIYIQTWNRWTTF